MVSPRLVNELLGSDRWLLLLDVRPLPGEGAEEFAIPLSLRLPLDHLRERLHDFLPFLGRDVVVVTEKGEDGSALKDLLWREGFRSVYFLEGGLRAWEAEELPLIRWTPVSGRRALETDRRRRKTVCQGRERRGFGKGGFS